MAKYVPDVKTQRWVVIAPSRTKRPASPAGGPDEKGPIKLVCPFCSGNEAITPPEVYRIGGGEKDKPGWLVRVVPNLFPITDIHEVIIHGTDHEKDIEDLPIEQVVRILTCYRDRYRAHTGDGQVLIFCNHGLKAGASLVHPHSQLVVIPKQINLDTLSFEPITNVVFDNTYFLMYCPDFSQWPYETWIVPKERGERFGETNDIQLSDLASVLQTALKKLEEVHRQAPVNHAETGAPFIYNFYIYHGVDWYIRIIPRFIHRAGFELGTGLNVNIVDPTEAAERLKNINTS
ncbi:hypothetical protein KKB64_01885 [Patescibacteria group bacterium]|nr:hypothetical protein [Patescibacteria group bacterium]MBU1472522.1 hypothetical protein [Patescibacteria group bacterium]MBU2460105.1 hypothetical protein [Patescibacteria group bacterium]MBU2544674.1 hypothetical protein [Patescibacteria group bacterium]